MRSILPFLLLVPALHASADGLSSCHQRSMPRIDGMDYHHARAALIVHGFRPIRIRPDRAADSPMVQTPRALGYHETADCGNAACSFRWLSHAGRPFSVIVGGEWLDAGLHDGVRVMACQF